ncbi:MAG: hypothetical protein JNM69_01200 [Archangium sp.]|nr:hypothetical protein [Archangium sp.]
MFVLLLVAGALVGVLLGVMALSMLSSVSVAGLTTPHPQRPARERRPHEYPDMTKREKRYPDVPPPLAPMTQTPKVLQGTAARALAPMESVFVTPSVPVVSSVLTSGSSTAPVFKAPTIAPPPPSFTPYNPPPVTAPQHVTAHVGQPVEAPPPLPPKSAKPMAERVQLAIDAGQAVASDPELVELLKSGHFIAALKHYREKNGVGLAEAKAAIDAWRAQAGHHEQAAQAVETAVTDPQIVAAIRKGKIIEAIKLYRAKTGVSLQDAKEAIDTWRRQLGR